MVYHGVKWRRRLALMIELCKDRKPEGRYFYFNHKEVFGMSLIEVMLICCAAIILQYVFAGSLQGRSGDKGLKQHRSLWSKKAGSSKQGGVLRLNC